MTLTQLENVIQLGWFVGLANKNFLANPVLVSFSGVLIDITSNLTARSLAKPLQIRESPEIVASYLEALRDNLDKEMLLDLNAHMVEHQQSLGFFFHPSWQCGDTD